MPVVFFFTFSFQRSPTTPRSRTRRDRTPFWGPQAFPKDRLGTRETCCLRRPPLASTQFRIPPHESIRLQVGYASIRTAARHRHPTAKLPDGHSSKGSVRRTNESVIPVNIMQLFTSRCRIRRSHDLTSALHQPQSSTSLLTRLCGRRLVKICQRRVPMQCARGFNFSISTAAMPPLHN